MHRSGASALGCSERPRASHQANAFRTNCNRGVGPGTGWSMVGGRENATAGVVCRVKAVVRRVLARRTHAREVGGGPHMGPCELAVNTRGGPHRGPAEGARDPPSARRVPRRAPCTAGDRRARGCRVLATRAWKNRARRRGRRTARPDARRDRRRWVVSSFMFQESSISSDDGSRV